ncbi:MAG: hypothetical protein LBU60_02205 [Clostridiales bacterium]|jgi:hypoxanthine phosphoribosyltransferase|nr:hypothetical protein [Clostridiales bacterium]
MKEELQQKLKQQKKEYISWSDFENFYKILTDKFTAAQYKPDFIYGIARGGLILAVTLSNRLGIPMIFDNGVNLAKHNKKILVVDDMSDTGDTFIELMKLYNTKKCAQNVKFASLLYRTGTLVIPDFYALHLSASMDSEEYRWIQYPWE